MEEVREKSSDEEEKKEERRKEERKIESDEEEGRRKGNIFRMTSLKSNIANEILKNFFSTEGERRKKRGEKEESRERKEN